MRISICKQGKFETFQIGDKPEDPVFTIPDLLVHLSSVQSDRRMSEVVKATEMKVMAGSSTGDCATFTDNFVKLLKERTGIDKSDYPFCEFSLYPAYPAKFVGLDKAAIGSAGQDDGICSFSALRALKNITKTPAHTAFCVFHSYEETGSNGTFGAQSDFMPQCVRDIMFRVGIDPRKHSAVMSKSLAVAADVTALYDVNYASAHDKYNACTINKGIGLERYTGSRGKSGSSEVSAELLGYIRENTNTSLF